VLRPAAEVVVGADVHDHHVRLEQRDVGGDHLGEHVVLVADDRLRLARLEATVALEVDVERAGVAGLDLLGPRPRVLPAGWHDIAVGADEVERVPALGEQLLQGPAVAVLDAAADRDRIAERHDPDHLADRIGPVARRRPLPHQQRGDQHRHRHARPDPPITPRHGGQRNDLGGKTVIYPSSNRHR
jgi:hypothetical protein